MADVWIGLFEVVPRPQTKYDGGGVFVQVVAQAASETEYLDRARAARWRTSGSTPSSGRTYIPSDPTGRPKMLSRRSSKRCRKQANATKLAGEIGTGFPRRMNRLGAAPGCAS